MALVHSSLRADRVCLFVRYRSAFFWTLTIARVFSSCSAWTSSSLVVMSAISAVSFSTVCSDSTSQLDGIASNQIHVPCACSANSSINRLTFCSSCSRSSRSPD